MRTRRWATLLAACAVSAIFTGQVWAYSGGRGTLQDPFQIADANDLAHLGFTPADQDRHFVLVADIDLAGRTWPAAVIPAFSGTFNGNGHSIRNVTIKGGSDCGLFGTLSHYGQVGRVNVVNVNIGLYSGHAGGLVGYNDRGVIRDCSSSGTVTGAYPGGGLVGLNDSGIIVNCSSSVDIQGGSKIGGLVGENMGGVISSCSSSGQVIGQVAANGSKTRERPYRYVGGLVGTTSYGGHVVNCHSSSKVIGDEDVGGLIGCNDDSVVNSYSTGPVTGRKNVGGLVGSGIGDVSHCLWDIETSGQTASQGGTGLSTAQMKSVQPYLSAGWDLVGRQEDGTSDLWYVAEGGYPVLEAAQRTLPGRGTPAEPYLISTPTDLGAVVHDAGACYRLTCDLDLAGIQWSTAAIPAFWGSFDGGRFCIRNLKIDGGGHAGLFGTLFGQGWVRSLSIVDSSVVSSGPYVGGLAGVIYKAVLTDCCYVGRVVGGGGSVGGLVGASMTDDVMGCFSAGEVSGDGDCIGGLVGRSGAVTNCYSTASVTGSGEDIGGLVGIAGGLGVTNCYSAGKVVGTGDFASGLTGRLFWIWNSFWDTETSGHTSGKGETGLTTAQMQDVRTYLAAGWDFVGETQNGTSDIWQMPEEGGYPVLSAFHGHQPPKLNGQGTPDDPYLVSTAAELGAVAHDPSACYRLVRDIDLAGVRWSPAVVPIFSGSFDGNDLTLRNLTVAGGAGVGLFSHLRSTAKVNRLAVLDVNVLTVVDVNAVPYVAFVGAVAGINEGDIADCRTTGVVTGSSVVGGLAGRNIGRVQRCHNAGLVKGIGASGSQVGGLIGSNGGDVTQCSSSGQVTGDWLYMGEPAGESVGGLAGSNSGMVSDCYSTSSVEGHEQVGGLVGYNTASVRKCYSAGEVSATGRSVGGLVGYDFGRPMDDDRVIGCYWDTTTSTCAASAGGTGLATAKMRDISTYLEAGWDFVGETVNGTEDIWLMPQGDYPRFASEGR